MAFLYMVNRPYLDTITHTHAGHKILTLAAVLLAIGLWMINKISNLDTSR
jgi:Flp pilus assembly protein TadB